MGTQPANKTIQNVDIFDDTLLIEMSYMGIWPDKKTRQNVEACD